MRRMFKKNQIVIAALAVMIAAAGYLNYSDRLFNTDKKAEEASGEIASQELLDISEEDLASASEGGGAYFWRGQRSGGRG